MAIPGPGRGRPGRLIPARFESRPNRFVVQARLPGGEVARCHLPDPGRLRELLLPGVELRLRPAAAGGVSGLAAAEGGSPALGNGRRTAYTVVLVKAPMPPRPWVSLDTTLPNRLAAGLLAAGRVAGLPRPAQLRAEVKRGGSRFDFLLTPERGGAILVEVKSVTLVESGTAWFPDAPTVRGTRHLRELTEIAEAGGRAAVLFVVQRHDARRVRPRAITDPDFATALAAARKAGVTLRACRYRIGADGSARWLGPLPVRPGG